jgi:hypothetical protein
MFLRMMAAGGLALALSACNTTTEVPLELGKDYYPLTVGAERVYAVFDRSYVQNVGTDRTSQLREQVTEAYRDAAGVLTYKVVRSVRATAADAWRVDSVQTLTVNAKNLLLTRSNLRTVELVFPVRAGAEWNKNAFNTEEDQEPLNRRYEDVGAPLTLAGRHYDNTVTTFSFDGVEGNLYDQRELRQVYAKGVGPVYREATRLYYCQPDRGGCPVGVGYIVNGTIHRETLLP